MQIFKNLEEHIEHYGQLSKIGIDRINDTVIINISSNQYRNMFYIIDLRKYN